MINEEDVLRGTKKISVPKRNGETVAVECRALNWAASCKVMSLADATEGMIHAVLNGLPKELATDAFLNELTPEALNEIAGTVLQLTNGIPALKKVQAARNPAPPAMPTSTELPANSGSADSVAPNVTPLVQPS